MIGLFETVVLAAPVVAVAVGSWRMRKQVQAVVKHANAEVSHNQPKSSSSPHHPSTPQQDPSGEYTSTSVEADDVAAALNRADQMSLEPLEIATKIYLATYPNTIPDVINTGSLAGRFAGESIYESIVLSNGWEMEFVCINSENVSLSDNYKGWFIIKHGVALYGNHYSKLIMH